MNLITTYLSSPEFIILQRLVVATILGAIIGFERERSGKVAGLRTHAMVSLGAALFTVISILAYAQFPSIAGVAGYDYHLVANIIVGIGFIGGGAILRTGTRVQGITTAATLWMVAAVGMAVGFGFYREAIASSVLAYLVLTVLWIVEKKFGHSIWYQSLKEEEAANTNNSENHGMGSGQ